MTYETTLRYLNDTAKFGIRLGLERMKKILASLGHPEERVKFVHIAGTNGKGSTAAMLASVLQCGGYRTGLYTSPHLLKYNERFLIDGIEISDAALAETVGKIKWAADRVADSATQFELLTCAALLWFAEQRCDIAVLEVGLGGRLDATNVIPVPEAAVITQIGLEHTEILGYTPAKIAAEKAGIVKENGTVVLSAQSEEVENTVKEICRDRSAALTVSDWAGLQMLSDSLPQQRFSWHSYSKIRLPLLGQHQLRNACTVLETVEVLKQNGWILPQKEVLRGLQEVKWPGRFECLSRNPTVIIDGGHNRQCADAIAAALKEYFPGQKIIFLLGILSDKDRKGVLDALVPLAKQITTVTPDSPRALPAAKLSGTIQAEYGFSETVPCSSVAEAVSLVKSLAGKDDVICACGSLYMIGTARKEFFSQQ